MGVEQHHISPSKPEKGFTMETQKYSKDGIIPFFGSKRFYIVENGVVAIQDEQGRIMRVAKRNSPFGYENFDGESSFQGKVLTPEASVRAIDIDESNLDTMFDLYRLIAQTDRFLERRQHFIERGYNYEQVAQALLDTAVPSSAEDGLLVVPFIQSIIGEIAHAPRETVSTTTSAMEREGFVIKGRGEIEVTRPKELRDRINRV